MVWIGQDTVTHAFPACRSTWSIRWRRRCISRPVGRAVPDRLGQEAFERANAAGALVVTAWVLDRNAVPFG